MTYDAGAKAGVRSYVTFNEVELHFDKKLDIEQREIRRLDSPLVHDIHGSYKSLNCKEIAGDYISQSSAAWLSSET